MTMAFKFRGVSGIIRIGVRERKEGAGRYSGPVIGGHLSGFCFHDRGWLNSDLASSYSVSRIMIHFSRMSSMMRERRPLAHSLVLQLSLLTMRWWKLKYLRP